MGKKRNDSPGSGRVGRRQLLALAAMTPLAMRASTARADLFGGDIGVLLAQLEQQLTMVAKAIETVQGIMASVERLQRVAEQGKTMLMKVQGQGGFKGFLEGVHDLALAGRGAVKNMQRLNVRGGQWKSYIAANHGNLSTADAMKLTVEAADMNARFLRDVGAIHESFGEIATSVTALEALQDATEAAETVDGIVGQTQLLGRQVANLGVIATQHASASTTHASLYTSELERQALERETQRKLSEGAWKDFDVVEDRGPTDVRWELE